MILSVCSQKGGVGKTTVALNLTYALAQRGRKAILVDADPQGAVGLSLRGRASQSAGLAECLRGEARAEDLVLSTRIPGLGILPLGKVEAAWSADWAQDLADGQRLRRALESLVKANEVVVIDTPSGLFGVSLGALRACDRVLVPVQAEPLAIRSLQQVFEALARVREEGCPAQLAGILLTMLQSRVEDSLAVAREAWDLFPGNLVLETVIPRDGDILHASTEGVPVALLRRQPPPVATVFDQLAAELEPILGLEIQDEVRPLMD
ncbi:MAG: ParA family protein [Acidobacteria bacterium]|nr:ParA family protein [Acidobacteriota bacterium]